MWLYHALRTIIVPSALISLALMSCTAEMRQGFKEVGQSFEEVQQSYNELHSLSQAILKQFPAESVTVNIENNTSITIELINSELSQLSEETRKSKAKEIANFSKQQLQKYKEVESISVVFTTHRSFVILEYTDSSKSYTFKATDLT